MARVLVCGTLAYDDIGVFDGRLAAETRNVKLSRLHRAFGGCAMNIAYNLAGLGHQAVPFVYAGDDYSGDYARHVAAHGISEAGIFQIPNTPSARGIVLTGIDGDQFTAFYPGPSGLERWPRDLDALLAENGFDAAVLAPDLPEKTIGCAGRLTGIELVVWCPGQYAELLARAEIEPLLAHAHLIVVNAHEWSALTKRVEPDELSAHDVRAVITHGAGPVTLFPCGGTVPVPAIPQQHIVDPTGCGDAFVAGLTSALLAREPLTAAVGAGIRLAARCITCSGAQRHPVAR